MLVYSVFALLVAGSALALQYVWPDHTLLGPFFWLLYAVVFILTFVAYVVSDLGIRKGTEMSIYGIMAGLFVKLIASLVVVTVLIIKFPENKMVTAYNFFSLYFLFTAFEVTYLLRNLRDQNKTRKIGDR